MTLTTDDIAADDGSGTRAVVILCDEVEAHFDALCARFPGTGVPPLQTLWRSARRPRAGAPGGCCDTPKTDDAHSPYSKREIALDMVHAMRALGFDRFSIVGHDPGARVAHRLALDHPQAVDRLVMLDMAPTLAQ